MNRFFENNTDLQIVNFTITLGLFASVWTFAIVKALGM